MCVGPRTSEAKAAFLGRLTARLKPCPPKNQSTLQFPRQIDPPVFFWELDGSLSRTTVLIQMMIRVQPGLGTPIYLQIESQVKHAIAAGALNLDDALPPVRKLAAELRINPNTVARAYQNLERDGVLRTVPGGGCYVSGQSPGLLKSEKLRRLTPLATQLAVEAKQLRLPRKEVLQLVETSYDELDTKSFGGTP
jgi:GntR family transcriptional regulator